MQLAGVILIVGVAVATYLLADALDAVDAQSEAATNNRAGSGLTGSRLYSCHSHHDDQAPKP